MRGHNRSRLCAGFDCYADQTGTWVEGEKSKLVWESLTNETNKKLMKLRFSVATDVVISNRMQT